MLYDKEVIGLYIHILEHSNLVFAEVNLKNNHA